MKKQAVEINVGRKLAVGEWVKQPLLSYLYPAEATFA